MKILPKNLPAAVQAESPEDMPLAARRAWSGEPLGDSMRANNQEWLSQWIDQDDPYIVAPHTDYLVLGLCMAPEAHEILKDWVAGHTFELSKRIIITRGKILVDGRQAGHVGGSRASMTRYGKKLNFTFSGTWFRDPSTGDGAGLTEAHALDLIHQFGRYLVSKTILSSGFILFHSIDRWDVVMELRLQRPGSIDPIRLADGITLPRSMNWNDVRSSRHKNGGHTIYASTTTSATATRSTHTHICMYQKPDARHSVRVEVRVPGVRNVNAQNSMGQISAAHYIRELLNCFSPLELSVAEPGASTGRLRGDVTVKALDFGPIPPEDYARRPYAGHPGKTLRRMARTGMTLLRRSLQAMLVANMLTTVHPDYLDNLPVQKFRQDNEVWEARPAGWVEYDSEGQVVEEREALAECVADTSVCGDVADISCGVWGARRCSETFKAPVEPEPVEPVPVDPNTIGFDVVGGVMTAEEARPGDHGFTLEQLADHIPLNLDELQELQMVTEWYVRRKHAGSKPFWAAKRLELSSLRMSPEMRLDETWTREMVLDNIHNTDNFMRRFIDPTCHETLASSDRWSAIKTDREIEFWRPGRTPDRHEPDIVVEA